MSEPNELQTEKNKKGPTPAVAIPAGACTRGAQASEHTRIYQNRTRSKRTEHQKNRAVCITWAEAPFGDEALSRERRHGQRKHNISTPRETPPPPQHKHTAQQAERGKQKREVASADRDKDRRQEDKKKNQDRKHRLEVIRRLGGIFKTRFRYNGSTQINTHT